MYLVSVDPMDLSKINNAWRDQNKKQISWSKIRIRRFKIGCLTWWISYLLTILGIAEADGLALNPDIRIGDFIICPSIQDWQNQKLLWNGLSTQWYLKLNTTQFSSITQPIYISQNNLKFLFASFCFSLLLFCFSLLPFAFFCFFLLLFVSFASACFFLLLFASFFFFSLLGTKC